MKKGIKMFIIVIIVVCVILICDFVSMRLFKRPVLAIEKENNCEDCSDRIYHSLFYEAYYCFDQDELFVVGKNAKFTCPEREKRVFNIIDNTNSCPQALEKIYEDDEYDYYLPCVKSENIYIKFYGEKKTYRLREVLEKKMLTIDELIENGLDVYKR